MIYANGYIPRNITFGLWCLTFTSVVWFMDTEALLKNTDKLWWSNIHANLSLYSCRSFTRNLDQIYTPEKGGLKDWVLQEVASVPASIIYCFSIHSLLAGQYPQFPFWRALFSVGACELERFAQLLLGLLTVIRLTVNCYLICDNPVRRIISTVIKLMKQHKLFLTCRRLIRI